MENHFIYLSWALIGPYLAIIISFCILLYITGLMIKKDTKIVDYITNILIVLGAIAWVVITS
jgi:hypothetical protein